MSRTVLNDTHGKIDEFLVRFRDQVCEACSWSQATYYRKKKGRIKLTAIEVERIKSIAVELARQLYDPV